MVTGRDPDELEAPERDPVVRMPKRMYVPTPAPEPSFTAPRVVLLVAAAGALLGATLGAVGLAIVWATMPAPAPVVVLAPAPRAERPRSTGAGAVFELDLDAGAPREVTDPAEVFLTTQQALGRGRTLPDALRSLAVPRAEAAAVVGALRRVVDMRTLLPDDRVAVLRDPMTREVRRVEYRRTTTQVWAAVREADRWRGVRMEVVLSSRRVAAGFRVEGSVAASLEAAGLQPEAAARLAEVFPSLALPPRLLAGDVVRVVLEEERINNHFYRYTVVHGVDYRGAWGHRRGFWVSTGGARGDFFDREGRTFETGPLHAPVPDGALTPNYNPARVHPVTGAPRPHNGVDFVAPVGTPVFAAADGVVVSAGDAGASGLLVVLEHPALRIRSGYGHLSRVAPGMRQGAAVRAGQLVGHVGTTGRSTGPHLHFSVKRNGLFFDPMTLLGVRRALRDEARPLFDARARLIQSELEQVAVDGRALVDAGVDAAPASAPPAPRELAPLEVGNGQVEGYGEDIQDPLDETGEVQ